MSSTHRAKHASWAYAEQHVDEEDVTLAARERAASWGISSVTPGTAAALSILAAANNPQSMVEVGTGVGISSWALLRGAPHAVLTTIDPSPEHIATARSLLREAGVAASRTRMITGFGEQVLPRLTQQGYDLVLIDTEPATAAELLEPALRLLRVGGMLIVNDALDSDAVPMPAVRDSSTVSMRGVEKALRDEDRLITAMFPTGTGLLTAVRVR